MGSFPIAQVREPYTTVKFLAERIDLLKLLKLQHPDNDDTWSAIDICNAWASKRNFITARTARLDSYRAANSLLRMALEGKICIHIYPPDWVVNKGNTRYITVNDIYLLVKTLFIYLYRIINIRLQRSGRIIQMLK